MTIENHPTPQQSKSPTRKFRLSVNLDELLILNNALKDRETQLSNKLCLEVKTLYPEQFTNAALELGELKKLQKRINAL